jgi:hypothetical protein
MMTMRLCLRYCEAKDKLFIKCRDDDNEALKECNELMHEENMKQEEQAIKDWYEWRVITRNRKLNYCRPLCRKTFSLNNNTPHFYCDDINCEEDMLREDTCTFNFCDTTCKGKWMQKKFKVTPNSCDYDYCQDTCELILFEKKRYYY